MVCYNGKRVLRSPYCLQMLDEAALYEQYTRVISTEPSLNEETEDVCALLKASMASAGLAFSFHESHTGWQSCACALVTAHVWCLLLSTLIFNAWSIRRPPQLAFEADP